MELPKIEHLETLQAIHVDCLMYFFHKEYTWTGQVKSTEEVEEHQDMLIDPSTRTI